MLDDDIIEVIDDNNNHVRLHILFTFNDDNTNTDYLFITIHSLKFILSNCEY